MRARGISRQETIATLTRIRAMILDLEHGDLVTAIELTDDQHKSQLVVVGGYLACRWPK